MKVILIAIVLFQPLIIFGQNVFVKKVNNEDKAHLVIGIKKGDSTDWYFAGCSFKSVALLPDTTKIRLIGDLLDFTADTIMCDNIIFNLSGRYTVIRKQPLSRQYNLQIDALILINYIALSSKAFYYSPYPLLYDKETEKEICCNSEGLNTVIAIYKNWYLELKQNGFSDYFYPLYDKRYEWFAGKFKQQKFKDYPRWDNFFDCKEIE
ncbi:hypothetical protein [Gynurincola endophyticus]|uniref:hypothetical protein n=1 Tax=Gynurincola endophyticus TaxID=2479004 RepID=UPI000F8E8E32|nr:hypothetical protein [Gynurincola endophyticus]